MLKSVRFFLALCVVSAVCILHVVAADYAAQWKITSIKICRTGSGAVSPHIEAMGSFPVYTFFVPRPVWTVNGAVVEAHPNSDRGKITSFQLLYAGSLLKSGTKNTVKFALPDQNGSKIFYFDVNKTPVGQCYELF